MERDLVALLAGFLVSAVTTPVGVSGAVFLLPIQMSLLQVPNPQLTPTNLVFNVVSGPGGLLRYARRRQIDRGLALQLIAGSVPGVILGALLRVYVVPNISLTAELSGIKIPQSVSPKYNAHYADFDTYATVNLVNNAGLQIGWRSFDIGYLINKDSGSFVLRGLYFAGVVRY